MMKDRKNGTGIVYVYNKTRETFVATEATVADSYVRRLVGLLGKTKRWARFGCGLWIVPSRGVHTIGMLFPIDLIFLSKEKEVVYVEEFVRPSASPRFRSKPPASSRSRPTRFIAPVRRSAISWRFRRSTRRLLVRPAPPAPDRIFVLMARP